MRVVHYNVFGDVEEIIRLTQSFTNNGYLLVDKYHNEEAMYSNNINVNNRDYQCIYDGSKNYYLFKKVR